MRARQPIKDRIANSIVKKCIRIQECWAAFMGRTFDRFSLRGKKALLVCLCILLGGYSFYLIVKPAKKFSGVTPIKRPAHILKSGEPKKTFDADAEYKRIEQLKRYRDSIYKQKIK